ncbi:hypothetical protein diail_3029 [Diaporthe ilicicola]|nr:hypothetical protein diail_3029 [Diaporthe ilicicola]
MGPFNVVIDLIYLSQVQVDSTGLARVGPGNKFKDVAEKLHAANGRGGGSSRKRKAITRALSNQNPDLFWAIRGAGASFGIVTEFVFQTKPEPKEVLSFAFTVASTDPASLSASFKAYHQITNDINLDRRFSAAVVVLKDQLQISGAFFGPQSDSDRINLESRIPGITECSVVAGLTWMGHMNRTFDSIASMSGYKKRRVRKGW